MATASIASGQEEAPQSVLRKNRPRSCFKSNNSYPDLRSEDSLISSQLEHGGSRHSRHMLYAKQRACPHTHLVLTTAWQVGADIWPGPWLGLNKYSLKKAKNFFFKLKRRP